MLCSNCKAEVRPVVALDLDGTLGDYHSHLMRFAEAWLGYRLPRRWDEFDGSVRLAEFMELDDKTYREIKLAFRMGGNKRTMPVFPGASRLSSELHRLGVEVWITTSRPYLRLDNIDPDTREWLRRNAICYDRLTYEDDKYSTLIEQVGADRVVCVLDDLPKQLQRAGELGLNPLMRATAYNRAHHKQFDHVPDLEYARLAIIQDLADWREHHG